MRLASLACLCLLRGGPPRLRRGHRDPCRPPATAAPRSSSRTFPPARTRSIAQRTPCALRTPGAASRAATTPSATRTRPAPRRTTAPEGTVRPRPVPDRLGLRGRRGVQLRRLDVRRPEGIRRAATCASRPAAASTADCGPGYTCAPSDLVRHLLRRPGLLLPRGGRRLPERLATAAATARPGIAVLSYNEESGDGHAEARVCSG